METFTFLFTDIEGSTVLLRCLGEGLYGQVLADRHALIRSGLAAHGGREVDTQGDAFFAVFSSSRGATAVRPSLPGIPLGYACSLAFPSRAAVSGDIPV